MYRAKQNNKMSIEEIAHDSDGDLITDKEGLSTKEVSRQMSSLR